MKRIAGLLIAAGLVLNGCVAKSEPEPAYQAESFPLAAASWPLQSLLQNLHRQLSPDPDWLPPEASGSTQAAWRSLIQVVNPQPRMILAYEPSAAMRRELQDYDTLWQAQTIGYDALVLITGSENPVDSLSLDQIRDIYAGKITNWKQVGGLDQPIRIYAQDENSGLQTAFERQVMQGVSIVNPTLDWFYERPASCVRRLRLSLPPQTRWAFPAGFWSVRSIRRPISSSFASTALGKCENVGKREISAETPRLAGKQHRLGRNDCGNYRLAVKCTREAVVKRSGAVSHSIKEDENHAWFEVSVGCADDPAVFDSSQTASAPIREETAAPAAISGIEPAAVSISFFRKNFVLKVNPTGVHSLRKDGSFRRQAVGCRRRETGF